MKEEPIRVQIRGTRKTYFPPLVHPPADDSPPDKRLTLNWVYPFHETIIKNNHATCFQHFKCINCVYKSIYNVCKILIFSNKTDTVFPIVSILMFKKA